MAKFIVLGAIFFAFVSVLVSGSVSAKGKPQPTPVKPTPTVIDCPQNEVCPTPPLGE